MNTFKTLDELPRALSHATAPGFNVSAVDSNGNIGWHVMGKIAIRPDKQTGMLPLEGWSGRHDKYEYLDIDQNPHLYNPESGYIASANYYPEIDFGGRKLNGQWQPQERINRLHDIIPQKNNWDSESMKEIFLDNTVRRKNYLSDYLFSIAPKIH